jgi:hypothetical protein
MPTVPRRNKKISGTKVVVVDAPPYNVDPERWGPGLWTFLHYLACSCPDRPGVAYQQACRQFFNALKVLLPCVTCRQHYTQLTDSHPLNVSSAASLQEFVLFLHNQVNLSAGCPTWTMEQVVQAYPRDSGEAVDEVVIVSTDPIVTPPSQVLNISPQVLLKVEQSSSSSSSSPPQPLHQWKTVVRHGRLVRVPTLSHLRTTTQRKNPLSKKAEVPPTTNGSKCTANSTDPKCRGVTVNGQKKKGGCGCRKR